MITFHLVSHDVGSLLQQHQIGFTLHDKLKRNRQNMTVQYTGKTELRRQLNTRWSSSSFKSSS